MNTISIDPHVWKGAEAYARLHNISLEKLIEKALTSIMGNDNTKEPYRIKREEELSPEIRSLIGAAKSPSQGQDTDLDGKEARMEYLRQKYGL